MDAHTLAKLTCASALRGLTGRFSLLLGTGPYACRISITPTFVQLMPHTLTLHSITVRGAGNDSREDIGSFLACSSCMAGSQLGLCVDLWFYFCRMLPYYHDRAGPLVYVFCALCAVTYSALHVVVQCVCYLHIFFICLFVFNRLGGRVADRKLARNV